MLTSDQDSHALVRMLQHKQCSCLQYVMAEGPGCHCRASPQPLRQDSCAGREPTDTLLPGYEKASQAMRSLRNRSGCACSNLLSALSALSVLSETEPSVSRAERVA